MTVRTLAVEGILYFGDLGGVHGARRSPSAEKFYTKLYTAYLNSPEKGIVTHLVATPAFYAQKIEKEYLEVIGFDLMMAKWGSNTDLYIIDLEKFLSVVEDKPSFKKEWSEYNLRLEERKKKDIEEGRVHPLYDLRPGDHVYKQGGAFQTHFIVVGPCTIRGYTDRTIFKQDGVGEGDFNHWLHTVETPYVQRVPVE